MPTASSFLDERPSASSFLDEGGGGDIDESGLPSGISERERKRLELSSQMAAAQVERDKAARSEQNISEWEHVVEPFTGRGLFNQPGRVMAALGGVKEHYKDPFTGPIVHFPKPKGPGVGAGLDRLAGGLLEGLTDPDVLATLPAGAVNAGRALFAYMIGKEIPEQVEQAARVVGDIKSTPGEIVEAVGQPVVGSAMLAGLGRTHSPKPGERGYVGEVPEFPGLPDPDLVARNVASPGTLRPQEQRAWAPPVPEPPPEMFSAGEVPFKNLPRFGGMQVPEPVFMEPFMQPKGGVPVPQPPKVQAETPTLLRTAIQSGEETGLTKSVGMLKEVTRGDNKMPPYRAPKTQTPEAARPNAAERRAALEEGMRLPQPEWREIVPEEGQFPPPVGMPQGTLSRLQSNRIQAGKENVRSNVRNNPPKFEETKPVSTPVAETPSVIDQVAAQSPAEFREWAKTQEGGVTTSAYKLGESMTSPEGVAKLRELEAATQAAQQAKIAEAEAGNMAALDDAVALGTKKQFFTEALESATGTKIEKAKTAEDVARTKAPEPATPVEAVGAESPAPAAVSSPAIAGSGGGTPINPAPVSVPIPEPSGGATAMKYRKIDQERAERGLEPLAKGETVSDQLVMDDAMARIEKDPELPDRLVKELNEDPRVIEDVENHILLLRKIELRNEFQKAAEEQAKAFESGVENAAVNERVTDLSAKLGALESASRVSGSSRGRALRSLRVMANEDMSLAGMEARAVADRGGAPVTVEERLALKKLADDYAAKTEAMDRRQAELEAREAEVAKKEAASEIAKKVETDQKVEKAKRKPAKLTALIARADEAANAARERIKSRGTIFGSGPFHEVPNIRDLAIIGASHLVRGIAKAAWRVKMKLEFGDEITPHLDAILKESLAEKKNAETSYGKRDLASEKTAAIEGLKESAQDGATPKEIGKYAKSIAENFIRSEVEAGKAAKDVAGESVDAAVHDALKEAFPDITISEASDAWTGRGNFKLLDTDPVKVRFREARSEQQKLRTIEQLEKEGQAPKTGQERQADTDLARRRTKQINEIKKKLGIVTTDPATQLRSALDAIHTRNKNRIADLRHENATRKRIVREKREAPSDAESLAQRAEIERLKAENREIFGDRELTDGQRLDKALKAAERAETQAEADLSRAEKGDFGPSKTSKPTPDSAKLDEVRARTAAIRERATLLRDLDSHFQDQKRIKEQTAQIADVDRRIEEVTKQINEGDVKAKPASTKPVIPELADKRAELAELNKIKAKLQAAEKGKSPSEIEQAKIEDVQKRIDEVTRQINEGDVAAKPKPASTASVPRQELQAELAELNKIRQTLRNASKPKKSAEEISLQAAKTRIVNRMVDQRARIDREDFAPNPKKEFTPDAELNRLQAEAEQVKNDYEKAREKKIWDDLNVFQKTGKTLTRAYDASRMLLTTGEFSFVLRQGKFNAASHPIRTAKALVSSVFTPRAAFKSGKFRDLFGSMASEPRARAIELEILNHPEAKQARADKLALIEENQKLTKQEEILMGDWSKAIPVVSAFNRAARVYLNKVRFDTWLAMKKAAPNTKEAGRAIAAYVNESTGRGTLGKAGEPAAVLLARVMFSPRFLASRLQYMAGHSLWMKSDLATKKVIAKEYARTLIGMGIYYAMLKSYFGSDDKPATVETDPRSSDFGKVKVGDTRVDPMAGLAQIATFGAITISGSTKNTVNGAITPIRGKVPYGKDDWRDVAGRFAWSKAHPTIGAAANLFSGTDLVGNVSDPKSEALRGITPMTYVDIYQALRDQDLDDGAAMALLAFLGEGLQTYKKKKKASK